MEDGEGEEEEEEERWGVGREHEPRVLLFSSSSIDGDAWAQPLRRRRESVAE